MTTPLPTRFNDDELAVIDRLVAEGVGRNRSEIVRQAVHHLDESLRRARRGQLIADSYRQLPQSAEEDAAAMANALAITESESW